MHSLLVIIAGKLIALIIGIFCFKFLFRALKIIFIQVFVALLCECYAKYLVVSFNHSSINNLHIYNNTWVFNIYMLIEFILLSLAGRLLLGTKLFRIGIPVVIVLQTILWGVNIYVKGMNQFASWSFICGSIIIVAIYIAILFQHSLFTKQNILTQPVFWLCMSVILFFGCDVPYWGLHNYLDSKNLSLDRKLFIINYILNFVRYPLVAVSFLICGLNASKKHLKITA